MGDDDRFNLRDGFRRGLSEAGFVEGRNMAVDYRFAENQPDRLPALAADLVGRKVAVIAASGGGAAVLAAKAATANIPIVFVTGGDPIGEGFVANLNRPGGNITGASFFGSVLGGKALALLQEFVPNAAVTALLVNPKNPKSARVLSDTQEAARMLGRQLLALNASTPGEIETAFATLREQRAGALLAYGDAFLGARRQQIVALAARDAIPVMYSNRDFVDEGRADELWQRYSRRVSPGGAVRRTCSQRRETC